MHDPTIAVASVSCAKEGLPSVGSYGPKAVIASTLRRTVSLISLGTPSVAVVSICDRAYKEGSPSRLFIVVGSKASCRG